MRTAFLIASGLLAAAIATPSQAQSDADQMIALHCIKNQNEWVDLVLDLARNTYSFQLSMANFNGPGSTYTEPPTRGDIQSVSQEEVDFTYSGRPYQLSRLTGLLSAPQGRHLPVHQVPEGFLKLRSLASYVWMAGSSPAMERRGRGRNRQRSEAGRDAAAGSARAWRDGIGFNELTNGPSARGAEEGRAQGLYSVHGLSPANPLGGPP